MNVLKWFNDLSSYFEFIEYLALLASNWICPMYLCVFLGTKSLLFIIFDLCFFESFNLLPNNFEFIEDPTVGQCSRVRLWEQPEARGSGYLQPPAIRTFKLFLFGFLFCKYFFIFDYQARAWSARARRACTLRALGLLLADGAPQWEGGRIFDGSTKFF